VRGGWIAKSLAHRLEKQVTKSLRKKRSGKRSPLAPMLNEANTATKAKEASSRRRRTRASEKPNREAVKEVGDETLPQNSSAQR